MRLAAFALALSLALSPIPVMAQPAPTAESRSLFVIRYRAGPAWVPGRPALEQNLREHGAYVARLLREGRVFAGGPFTDAEGGMAIVWAADRAEADAILAADPAQRDGVMIGEVNGWTPSLDSRRPLRPQD